LVALLSATCLTAGAFALSACGDKSSDERDQDIVAIYNLYVANADGTPLSYEDWLATIKGEKGDTGATGATGAKGDTGATGNGISSIAVASAEERAAYTATTLTSNDILYKITYTSGNPTYFVVSNGAKGDKGDKGATVTKITTTPDEWGVLITVKYSYSDDTEVSSSYKVIDASRNYYVDSAEDVAYLADLGVKNFYVTTDAALRAALNISGSKVVLGNDITSTANKLTAAENTNLVFNGYKYVLSNGAVVDSINSDGSIVYSATDLLTFSVAHNSLNSGDTVKLANDITVTQLFGCSNFEYTLDLNNHTLTTVQSLAILVNNSSYLTIKNGTLKATGIVSNNGDNLIQVAGGSTVKFDHLNVVSTGCVLYPRGEGSTVEVLNSNILVDDGYCISTNAETPENYGVVITLRDSTIRNIGASGVIVNVPSTVTIDNCTITGARQAFVLRGGTATVTNSTLQCLYDCKDLGEKFGGAVWDYARAYGYYNTYSYEDKAWGTGNDLYRVPVVLGNKSSTQYNYKTKATFTNVNITSVVNVYAYEQNNGVYTYGELTETTVAQACTVAIYAIGNNNKTVTLDVNNDSDHTITGSVIKGNSLVTITGVDNVTDRNVAYVPTAEEQAEIAANNDGDDE
jgi:hypothetical protein